MQIYALTISEGVYLLAEFDINIVCLINFVLCYLLNY